MVDTLSTWGLPFAVPLREAMPEYIESGEPRRSRACARPVLLPSGRAKRLKGAAVNYAARAQRSSASQVDTINLLTCLPAAEGGHRRQDALAVLPARRHRTSASSCSGELAAHVRRRRGARPPQEDAVRQAARRGRDASTSRRARSSVFERALEDYLMRRAFVVGHGRSARRRRHHQLPVGEGRTRSPTCASSSRAMSVGMPVERMREELIVV